MYAGYQYAVSIQVQHACLVSNVSSDTKKSICPIQSCGFDLSVSSTPTILDKQDGSHTYLALLGIGLAIANKQQIIHNDQ